MSRTPAALAGAVVALAATAAHASLIATAEIVGSPIGGGLYHYTVTLHNTGTTTIGALWFSWIPGENFMTAAASSITSPAGWSGFSQGGAGSESILWQASTPSNRLAAGGTLTGFSFNSAQTPQQLAGLSPSDSRYHMTDSYVYIGGARGGG
ncbi:MAG: hypothetical protein K2Q09_07995 [Phycisphaerales bacterium]|nr:hypothetical protein [Phycisphaerales bacterium]